MTLRFEELQVAIQQNDVPSVVAQLRGASEADRRAVNSKVRALMKDQFDFRGNQAAAAIVLLGCAGGVRQARDVVSRLSLGDCIDEAVTVLGDRSPAWLQELPAALLTGQDVMRNQWWLVRGLVRRRLVPKPDIPEYTSHMPRALELRLPLPRNAGAGVSIEDQLLADPDLLVDEVFRLFRVEGAGRSLYWADSWLSRPLPYRPGPIENKERQQSTWRSTLARLARNGAIDFDRLLDECLDVFLRDFRASELGWYVGLHDELAPTLEETGVRSERYLRLLAADASVGVGLAQKALEALLRADRLDRERLVAASPPALHRAEKGVVLRQLKLLGQIAKKRADLVRVIVETLEPALSHERPEVREAATALARQLDVASPPPIKTIVEVRAPVASEPTVDSTGPGERLPPPIVDPEELVAILTELVEDARNPVQLERALAGMVRTARLDVSVRRRIGEPLARRAREQMAGWPSALTGHDVRAMLASVAFTWATGTPVNTRYPKEAGEFALQRATVDEHLAPVTPTGVFAVRAREAVQLIADRASTELLAEPTFTGGGIDADVFIQRAKNAYSGLLGRSPPRYDLELAALRVQQADIAGRLDLDKIPRRVKGKLSDLLRELPSAVTPEIASGTVKRWGRNAETVVLAEINPTGSERTVIRMLTNLASPLDSYVRLTADYEYAIGYGAAIATWPLVAPWHPELIAAHLLRPLSRGLRPGKHDLAAAAVGCLANPGPAMGPLGHLALAMGCISAEGDTRTAAADVFASAAQSGRLHPALMAQAFVELARAGVFQSKRVAATLSPLQWQPLTCVAIAQTLKHVLGPLIDSGSKDLHVLLRLAAEMGPPSGVLPDDDRIRALAARKGTSELVAAARALAAVQKEATA